MRILHTMLRVVDLEKSIAFYTDMLGMKMLRRTDFRKGSLRWSSWATEAKRTAP